MSQGITSLLGKYVGGSRGQQRHGDAASGEPVDDFIDGAVAAARDHHAAALLDGQPRNVRCRAGARGGGEFRRDARVPQKARSPLDFGKAAMPLAPAREVIDQQRVVDIFEHSIVPGIPGKRALYNTGESGPLVL